MPNHSTIPADIAERYEVFEWRNGLAILASAHPDKWANILEVLRGFPEGEVESSCCSIPFAAERNIKHLF
jgi:hypothetical protein